MVNMVASSRIDRRKINVSYTIYAGYISFFGAFLLFVMDALSPMGFYYGTPVLIAMAGFIAYRRDGLMGPPFLYFLPIAYPLVTPHIVQDGMGFIGFSYRAPWLQFPEVMGKPLFLGAICCIVISLLIHPWSRTARVTASTSSGAATGRVRLLVYVSSMLTLLFSYLTEPGAFVLQASYSDIMTSRYSGLQFAGGAWALFAVTGFIASEVLSRTASRKSRVAYSIYWLSLVISILYLLGHARRSEVAGLLLLLYFVRGRYELLTKRAFVWVIGGALLIGMLVVVQDLRSGVDHDTETSVQSVKHLPGGPGNVLIGYLSAWELEEDKQLDMFPGSTYIDYFLRLPPGFLGLPRPPTVYDYIDARIPLTGGLFLFNEGLINFGPFGLFLQVAIYIFVINWSLKVGKKALQTKSVTMDGLIGCVLLVLIFRTAWYGFDPAIKSVVMAILWYLGCRLAKFV